MPGSKQACPTVAACWSPAMPRIGIGAAEELRRSVAPKCAAAVPHLRQQARGTREQPQQFVVPVAARGCRTAACARHWWHRSRAPRRRSAARAGSCPPCRRPARRARPAPARPARCRGSRRSWCRRNRGRAAARSALGRQARCPSAFSASHSVGGAPVLPDDGVDGSARPVARSQTTRRLALVGDADRRDIRRGTAGLRHAPRAHRHVSRQMSSGSCSTQPRRGKCWGNSCCATAATACRASKQDRARRGRALVDGEDERHESSRVKSDCFCSMPLAD